MRQDFREALFTWRGHPRLAGEQRQIQVSINPVAKDNYSIRISMTEKIQFKSASATVEETATMLTIAQGDSTSEIEGHPYPNPAGDIYRFNAIATNLEVQFWTKREEELTKIIEQEMPNGFFDFNDL